MTSPKQAISVVICAYTEKRLHDLIAAVVSVQQQTLPPLEIIVVIDDNPLLLERVLTCLPNVILVENHEPRGLSGARNSGIATAHGDIIAFLDDDATAAPDWLEQLSRGYSDPNVMGIGGAILPRWQGQRPRWFPDEFNWIVGCTYRGMPEQRATVRNLIGANMSLRRTVFDTVGGFSNGIGRIGTLPVGCEETELCIRAQQHWPHKQLLYEPAAEVYHRVPVQRAQRAYFRSRCYAEGLSKAQVAQLVGAADGLASEWTYTLRTLPLGVVRGLLATLRGDVGGVGRAVAIVAGLATTTIGYAVGRFNLLRHARSAHPQKRHA